MNKIFYNYIILTLVFIIFNSNSFGEIPELIGTIRSDTTGAMFGYRIIPLGNQNDDGFDDFMVYHLGKKVFLFYGGNPIDTICDLVVDSVQRPRNMGDINNDAYIDFVCPRKDPGGRWKLAAFWGGPTVDSVQDFVFGDDTLWGSLSAIQIKDINNNGSNEIICRDYLQHGLLLYELGPGMDSTPDLRLTPPNLVWGLDYSGFGDAIITGDFNGDSLSDLAVNLRFNENDSTNGEVWFYWGNIAFDTIPDFIIKRPGEYSRGYEDFGYLLENLGDINGDGNDDIYVGLGNSPDSIEFIYYCGPDIDTIPEIRFVDNAQKMRSAGDINNDDFNDLLTSYPSSFSGLGHVNIHLCNSEMDSVPDFEIWEDDIPEYQNYFGNDVSGVGDVNGDGIDDFAFSAVDAYNRGLVYIFAGWDDQTDVSNTNESVLPDEFILSQNTPNPFNSTTIIGFALPRKDIINLDIYNILGQQVVTLIKNQFYSSGTHKAVWDGNLSGGTPSPTGVYFYRISGSDFTQTRRMVLLK